MKKIQYTVQVKITLDTDAEIIANSMEQALAMARELKIQDFIDLHGEHNDSSIEVYGVYHT